MKFLILLLITILLSACANSKFNYSVGGQSDTINWSKPNIGYKTEWHNEQVGTGITCKTNLDDFNVEVYVEIYY